MWTSTTRRRLKIDFELIWRLRPRSLQLSPELVWPAAIPVLCLPHPIMLCLCDSEGCGESGITGGSSRCLQEAPSSPLWHKKQSIEDFFFFFLPPFLPLGLPNLEKTPLPPPRCLQGSPPPSPTPPPSPILIPDFPKIHPSSDAYLQPRGQTAVDLHCSPSLTSPADQSVHTFNSVIFHINYSGPFQPMNINPLCLPAIPRFN